MCGHETDGAGVPEPGRCAECGAPTMPAVTACGRCDDHCTCSATHPGAELTGGTIPPHVPGAYPRLSCCGGAVALVAPLPPIPEPIIDEGPGWLVAPPVIMPDDPSPVFAAVHLEPETGDGYTRAVLFVRVSTMNDPTMHAEAGAELTLDDLAALIAAAAAIGAAAGLADGRHRAALYFERAAEAMRLMEPYA